MFGRGLLQDFEKSENYVDLHNGIKVLDWDNIDKSVNWDELNKAIDAEKGNGVVVVGYRGIYNIHILFIILNHIFPLFSL